MNFSLVSSTPKPVIELPWAEHPPDRPLKPAVQVWGWCPNHKTSSRILLCFVGSGSTRLQSWSCLRCNYRIVTHYPEPAQAPDCPFGVKPKTNE